MPSLWTPGGEQPVERELSPDDAAVAEELAAMQEELANTPVSVVVANHAVGLFQLAAIHLNRRPPNLPEGRLAIDAMAALVEGMSGRLGDDEVSLREALAQLRMAFVSLSSQGAEPPSSQE